MSDFLSIGKPVAHESAHLHVSGEAHYIDDIPEPRNTLYAAIGKSTQAHARIKHIDLARVRAAPGVVDVIAAADLPGVNNFGTIIADDPLLADDEVLYFAQPIFVVAALDIELARKAALLADIEYEPLPAVLTARQAMACGSLLQPPNRLQRGEPETALSQAPHRLDGELEIGGQEQFYLEGHIALAVPREDGCMHLYSSTQHPDEVQHKVAGALGISAKDVVVETRRLGGGFGGKETQPALFACLAAVLARRNDCAVKLRPDRDDDMQISGKRHDFLVNYQVGYDDDGHILGLELTYAMRCGYSHDLSTSINERAVLHAENAYYIPHIGITSYLCKTNTVSNTAFRGYGGPQALTSIEYIVDTVARTLGIDPLLIRQRNFYGTDERNVAPYGQTIEDNVLQPLTDLLIQSSDYQQRRAEIGRYNAASPIIKRGLALTPVKFGISFTAQFLNQAGALMHVYTDGTIQLNHGGIEMGQGLNTKMAQVASEVLQVDLSRIRVMAANTGKVPNASATAASSGADLNGKAVENAAWKIRDALTAFAAEQAQVPADEVRWRHEQIRAGSKRWTFAELADAAYFARVPLWASGFYATPKVYLDRDTKQGHPFLYYAYGAAVSEVAIDTLSGETRLLRADILHDCGQSLNPALDIGQIEGAFMQGVGWLTCEELCWDEQGRLRTHAPSTYKIPTAREWPAQFNIRLLSEAAPGEPWVINREQTIYRSKAVGEPPLMLGISVWLAIRDAIASLAPANSAPTLRAPATPEAVLQAINQIAKG